WIGQRARRTTMSLDSDALVQKTCAPIRVVEGANRRSVGCPVESPVTVILRLLKRLFAPKLFGPRMLADPYRYYARLRSTAPVYWLDQVGAWVLTRYADVTAVLRSAQVSSDRANKAPQQAGPQYQALTQ